MTPHVFRSSMNRPNLLIGADRRIVLGTAVISGGMVFVLQTWFSFTLGIALWVGVLFAARTMAKADPIMREVYVSQLKTYSYTDELTGMKNFGYLPPRASAHFAGKPKSHAAKPFKKI